MSADSAVAAEPPTRGHAESFTYDAFLSYSHHDDAVAAGIQKGLHRIARRVGRLNALRVFRDTTDRPHRLGDESGVQPRRATDRVRQLGQDGAGVAHVPRPRVGDVRQTRHQHEPPAVAGLGLARYRLHQGLPRSSRSRRTSFG